MRPISHSVPHFVHKNALIRVDDAYWVGLAALRARRRFGSFISGTIGPREEIVMISSPDRMSMNTDHTWPKSKNGPQGDLHHLFSTDSQKEPGIRCHCGNGPRQVRANVLLLRRQFSVYLEAPPEESPGRCDMGVVIQRTTGFSGDL